MNSVREGTAFINTSTVTPAAATEVASAVVRKGCTILDVPLAGSRAAAEGGALILLVSGEQEVMESERDVLETIGQSINYFGPIGRSAVLKLANNQLAAALIRAMGESISTMRSGGRGPNYRSRSIVPDRFTCLRAQEGEARQARLEYGFCPRAHVQGFGSGPADGGVNEMWRCPCSRPWRAFTRRRLRPRSPKRILRLSLNLKASAAPAGRKISKLPGHFPAHVFERERDRRGKRYTAGPRIG